MDEPRIALLGAQGMLGSDLQKAFRKRGVTFRGFDVPEFDITDTARVKSELNNFDVIVNCAAYTDVDGAEVQPEKTFAINAEAAGELAEFAGKNGKYLLHFSTDFVFDGCKDTPYTEEDTPNPINVYGKSKLEGEKKIRQAGCDSCIIRIEWTYGMHGNNFVKKVFTKAKKGQQLNIVDDQFGSPTPTTLVSETVCELLDERPKGLFHYACSGYTSRFEMAKFITGHTGLNADISPCKTDDYPTEAKRPLNSRFDCGKISEILEENIPDWKTQLKVFLERI